jgi:formylmethanofuran dehydrogenase subunit E
MPSLPQLLGASAALHHHFCPRQVLGVRMGLFAGEILGIDLPQTGKRLIAIVETDGCAADGVAVATNCWVGRRTLRIEDCGKVAATFADTVTGRSVRIVPRAQARTLARDYAPEARNDKWETQLLGYQRIPTDLLFTMQDVALKTPIEQIVSRPGLKAMCEVCGEEIMNGREVVHEGSTLCRACAGASYYLLASDLLELPARQTASSHLAPSVSHL